MPANPISFLTPEQYFEIERAAETKSEYYDGQMFAMSGGTADQVVPSLRGRGCRVNTSDLRIQITLQRPFV